jgi:hypothetical protein
MATDDLNPDDLDDLVDMIKAGGGVECSLDPVDLNGVGVWVSLSGIRGDRLQGTTLEVTLFVVAPDGPPSVVLRLLADCYNLVRPRIVGLPRNGMVQSVRVTIPGVEGRPMPALSIPVMLHTTN